MAADDPHERNRWRVDRERVVRTLTFWLRPEFVLRVVNRFQKVAGFDRSIALASERAHGHDPAGDHRQRHRPRSSGARARPTASSSATT